MLVNGVRKLTIARTGAVVAVVLMCSGVLFAAVPDKTDGPAYQVNQMYLDFAEDLPVHPPTKLMMRLDITLGETEQGYVSPRQGVKSVNVRLEQIPKLKKKVMYESAIRSISSALVKHFDQWGYQGIIVAPHPEDIDANGKDLRLEGQTALRLVARSMTGRGRPRRAGPIWEGADQRDGKTYTVNQVIMTVSKDVAYKVDKKALMNVMVAMGDTETGYIAPRQGVKVIQVRLVDLPKLPLATFYESALQQINHAVTANLNRSTDGLYCSVSPKDIDADGKDVRFANQTALRLLVQKGELPPAPKYVKPVVVKTDLDPEPEYDVSELPDATEQDGPAYPINQIIIDYAKAHPGLPPLNKVMDVTLELTPTKEGYTAPRDGDKTITTKLIDLPNLPIGSMYASAIRYMNQVLVSRFNQLGYIGVIVAPNSEDINLAGQDIRPSGQTALRLEVQTGVVSQVRTIAAGDRISTDARVEHAMHDRITAHSPIQPAAEGDENPRNLLRKDLLDKYVYRMNRHPGRRVDVTVTSGEEPGTIGLDYVVTESKPWMIYAQISNTGTEQTSEWRERFGFIHNQLTNNDDVLSIDYITADFDSMHAVLASYEAPLGNSDTLRWKINGMWSEYTASDVGFARQLFTGEEWQIGLDLIANVWSNQEQFIDLLVGVQYKDIETHDGILDLTGESGFFLPHIGVRYERYSDTASTYAMVDVKANIPGIDTASQSDLERLGRLAPDDDYVVMSWNMTHSFFLEPWLNRQAWEDTTTWESSTLAHELYFGFKGQYAFDKRLIPQEEMTVGGLYTVRGYDESLIAGDTVVIATAEYRFHLPRILEPGEPGEAPFFGKPFRWSPQAVYGRPDWDLVLRTFIDYGKVWHSDRNGAFESDESLLGAGIGLEFMVKRNFSIRADYGWVLDGVRGGGGADEGDSRLHIVGTLLY